jgi:hypothetical protein
MLLGNSTPWTVARPFASRTTSVLSASSRCPAGTGSDVGEPTLPERSKYPTPVS